MIVIPAVDLRDGRCVQLVGGSYDREIVSLDDPLAVARGWDLEGFSVLHIVDLDAATGRGSNAEIVERIVESLDAAVQVGGGIRTAQQVARLLAIGAERVVVGTRALEDRQWLEEITAANPGRIIVAMDVRDKSVVTHGWQNVHGNDIVAEITVLDDLSLAGLLVTAVHREGQMEGPDVSLIEEVMKHSRFPIQASGGIRSVTDLRNLRDAGASAAIVGMALYTGALSAAEINEVFVG
ncbi:MAG: 1-(5-phosphoribosyl)-5-[(5-phosphoribosylamino)methylideneamino]imidazole-4-carboxamide isomerase [Gemmatimonadales bacterium]